MADETLFLGLQHVPVHLHFFGVVELLSVQGVHMVKIQIVRVHQPQGMLQLAAEIAGLLHLRGGQLGAEINLVPEIVDRFAHHPLVVPVGIAPGGVEKVDAQLIGPVEDGDALFVIAAPLLTFAHCGQAHTAETQAGDHGAVFSELLVLHKQNLTFLDLAAIVPRFFQKRYQFSREYGTIKNQNMRTRKGLSFPAGGCI